MRRRSTRSMTPAVLGLLSMLGCAEATVQRVDASADSATADVRQAALATWRALDDAAETPGTYWYQEHNCPLMSPTGWASVVQVTNGQPRVERVRLSFDGATALDVDLPAGLGCGQGAPVFSIAYDRPPGPVEVRLDLQGAASTSTIDVPATGTVWAVVDVQREREWGDITVYDSQPAWG